jgi:hypothetical protein
MTSSALRASALMLVFLAPAAHAQAPGPAGFQGSQTLYGQVVEVTKGGDRVSFKLSPAPTASGCKQVSLYTDAKGPKKNLPELRIEQAKQSGNILRVTYLLEPSTCQAYVVEAAPE